jgi:hypothetical protein
MNNYIKLNRSLISVSGDDSEHFLQGIISNDIRTVNDGEKAIYAYMLTPQGKYLFDFFIFKNEDRYIIDIQEEYSQSFAKRISLYRLRSKVAIEDISENYDIFAVTGDNVAGFFKKDKISEVDQSSLVRKNNSLIFKDPRNSDYSIRLICHKDDKQELLDSCLDEKDFEFLNKIRIEKKITEGFFDLEQDKSYPLQYGMEEQNGVDFNKGCYVGQEVTARTHHKGTIRKKVFLIKSDNKENIEDEKFTILTDQDSKKIGKILSYQDNVALALLDIKQVQNNSFITSESGRKFTIEKN